MRKSIYKWHRKLSLIVALPVVLWAASGFMHPIMTNIRPRVAQPAYSAPALDSNRFIVSLDKALLKNNIASIRSGRIVQINGNYFYQLGIAGKSSLSYISTQSGNLLKNGDELYARYLARIFTEGQPIKKEAPLLASLEQALPTAVAASNEEKEVIPEHDCCINATASIMNVSNGAAITQVEKVDAFTEEYKDINRLLPVYRVAFDRADGIRVYVETGQDRLAFAMDNKRAVFDKIFMLFHTMSWLNGLGRFKPVVEISLMLLSMLAAISGLYIFFTTKSKKKAGKPVSQWRWNHRLTSATASLFTLLFSFSGGYHALAKLLPVAVQKSSPSHEFVASGLNIHWNELMKSLPVGEKLTNLSLVSIDGADYWQLFHKTMQKANKKTGKPAGDFVKAMSTDIPNCIYVNAASYAPLPDGEKHYAGFLAAYYSGQPASALTSTTAITRFEGEYGFINKRLPVWKFGYAVNGNERWYIETSSGALAARIDDQDLYEGYSFSFLHKHHFMDFAGKSWRDVSTMFWAAMQIIMVGVGVTLYIKTTFTFHKKSNQ